MMHTCTHEAARGYAAACPDGAPCLPACLLVCWDDRRAPSTRAEGSSGPSATGRERGWDHDD
eukprot:2243356-Prymnesium_polylepis.1